MAKYTDEKKAQVVADILLSTTSLKEIATKHNVPHSTVTTWNQRLVRNGNLAQIETDETQVKKRIGDYLLEILETNLEAQIAQLKVFSNEEWLKEQSASEIGVLHGILHDKAIRMIGAFGDGSHNPVN